MPSKNNRALEIFVFSVLVSPLTAFQVDFSRTKSRNYGFEKMVKSPVLGLRRRMGKVNLPKRSCRDSFKIDRNWNIKKASQRRNGVNWSKAQHVSVDLVSSKKSNLRVISGSQVSRLMNSKLRNEDVFSPISHRIGSCKKMKNPEPFSLLILTLLGIEKKRREALVA